MKAKEYKDVITQLKGITSIDNFIIESMKYFLNESQDFDIKSSCNESLFYQLLVFITNPQHPNVQQILFATYGKKIIGKIFAILKKGSLNNLFDVKNHVNNELLLLTSHDEANNTMDKLEAIYNSILEIDYELNN